MSTLLTPDPQTFRALVADVAAKAKAKAKLPEAVNGRVESAVKLVLAHDVTVQEDGTIIVGSSSDPMKTYLLVGQACDCQDFAYGKAPEGWCQHRIAAGIAKRVQEQLAAEASPVPQEPTSLPQTSVETTAAVDVSTTLPEAPASVNVRVMIEGRDCQLTLRDTDEQRLLARLQTILQQYPAPQVPAKAQSQGPRGSSNPRCPAHPGRFMKEFPSKPGTYHCTFRHEDGSYCRERA